MTKELSTAREALEERLRRLLATFDSVDLAAPDAAVAVLDERHPFDSDDIHSIRELLADGLDDDWIVLNELHPGVSQGRIIRELGGYSVTALLIRGTGRGHTHPEGEIGLGFDWAGSPHMNGHGPGWVVFPPGSHHIPEVVDGQMLFLFFRPHGQVVWDSISERRRQE
ncbi:MAG: DUF4863 family protein [Planctomycetota bacterium]|nr:DUF4863 family protein [Planctomycetota bacterium]